jgi:hypothetical protein
MPRTLVLEPYQFCGETLYLSDRLIEVFDDVVVDLGLDEHPVPPRPTALVEWARTLRLRADKIERSHAIQADARQEQSESLRRKATVLLHAGSALLSRRGVQVKIASDRVEPGDRLTVVDDSPVLAPGRWVVEDTLGVVSVTRLDSLGRRTATSAAWTGHLVDAALDLRRNNAPLVTLRRGDGA